MRKGIALHGKEQPKLQGKASKQASNIDTRSPTASGGLTLDPKDKPSCSTAEWKSLAWSFSVLLSSRRAMRAPNIVSWRTKVDDAIIFTVVVFKGSRQQEIVVHGRWY